MADINELRKEITHHIEAHREKVNSIRWGRHHIEDVLKGKKKQEEEVPLHLRIKTKPKEQVYEDLKEKYKNSWKAPGYVNEEFSHVPVLKANVLSVWDRERALMPERSYKAPVGFQGFKSTYGSHEFGYPSTKLLPERYRNYLDETNAKFEDRVLRPSKYGPLKSEIMIDNLFNKQKERGWRLVNSMQTKDFGNDKHSTFEFEVMTRTNFTKPKK